ncbi:putative DNA helicase [Dioscorea sansibarensis]
MFPSICFKLIVYVFHSNCCLLHPRSPIQRLQSFIFDILMQHSRGKSALVFCSTRKGAQAAAQHLSQIALNLGPSNPFIKSKLQQEKLKEASLSCSDKQMQSCILTGVGYHNGGLCMKDRNLIEGLFLKGDIQILCTTNTLAHGINLPAHTVVIKSTQYFNKEKGLYLEYERSMVLQMCGRAGRPPFDDTGTVIIMTRKETVYLYENLLNGCEMVESQLLSCAIEHLNAEIVQLTVSDISLAIEWLKCSYLYVRIKKNPENYGVKKRIPSERLEKHMREICVQKINELAEYGMIWTDDDAFLLKPLEPGKLLTKFYLKFGTMKDIVTAPGSCSLEDALRIVCRSEEIAWIQLRRNEKKLLNDINSDKEGRLRFHVIGENSKRKKRIQTREEKIFVLANDCLTGDPSIRDLSLNQDMNSICSNGCRIARCMKECFIYKKSYKGAVNSTLLAKSLHQRLWDDSPYLLKQLPGIGMVTAKALRSAGISSFRTLAEADPRKIEILTSRRYPFGNHIKESLLSLPPKLEMQIEEAECKVQGKSKITVKLTRTPRPISFSKQHYADMIVGSEEDNVILFHEKIRAEEFPSPYVVTVLVACPLHGKVSVKADLIFDEYVGLDVHEKHVVSRDIYPIRNIAALVNEEMPASHSATKKIYMVEDDYEASSYAAANDGTHDLNNTNKPLHSSAPSFELLDEETDIHLQLHELGEAEPKGKTEEMIFDHIRKKSKNFPTLVTSKEAMDCSYEPLILQSPIRTPKMSHLKADAYYDLYGDDVILVDPTPPETPSSFFLDEQCYNTSKYRSFDNIMNSKPSSKPQGGSVIRVSPLESDPGSRRRPPTPSTHKDVGFLGFKSVFSFL